MIVVPSLWDHQVDVKNKARTGLAEHRSVIIQAEPGFGKTRLSKNILGEFLNRSKRPDKHSGNAVFCVHRRGLVDNASDSFSEEPRLPHGLIMSGRDTDWHKNLHVGSIDTMLSWYVNGSYQTDWTFDLIVFDECHSHLTKLQKFLKAHNEKRSELGLAEPYVVGLSATPAAKGQADTFGQIITGPTTKWLIEEGFLSSFRYFRGTQGQLGKLVKRGNEYTSESVSAAMDGLAGDLVRDWKQFAEARPTVGFFPRRAHASEARDLLIQAGVRAEYVDGQTSDDDRNRIFDHLNSGRIDYICNVGVVERGTNIPAISCVQLCTSIGSLHRYRQMIGRGSRTADGKVDCIVLDHGGNVAAPSYHGYFEDEVEWPLDISTKPIGDHVGTPVITCPRCKRQYRGGTCSGCGYEPSRSERAVEGLIFNGSSLQEITKDIKAPNKKKQTCEQIMISALYSAGRSNRTWKQAMGIAYGKAKQQGTRFRVPKSVTVAGQTYDMLPYGSPKGGLRVSQLFDFVRRK